MRARNVLKHCAITGLRAPSLKKRSAALSAERFSKPTKRQFETNMITRRKFLTGTAFAAGSAALLNDKLTAQTTGPHNNSVTSPKTTPTDPNLNYRPVITPNGVNAPWKIVDGAKVFH